MLGLDREIAVPLDELHQEECFRAVINLRHQEISPLPQISQHVRLALQVRLAIPVHLRHERRAVRQIGPVHLADASAPEGMGAEEPLPEVRLYAFADDPLKHRSSNAAPGCPRGVPPKPLR